MTLKDQADRAAQEISRVYIHSKMANRTDPATGETISQRQAAILDALCDIHPKFVGDVARRLGVTAATLSLTLDRMERDGLILREADAGDRRRVAVLLTARGQRLQRSANVVDPARLEILLGTLAPADRSAALKGLSILADAATRQGE